VPSKQVDVSAFSFSKRTGKALPTEFVKKGTGNGGTMVRIKGNETTLGSTNCRSNSLEGVESVFAVSIFVGCTYGLMFMIIMPFVCVDI